MLRWLRRFLIVAFLFLFIGTVRAADVQIWGRDIGYWFEQVCGPGSDEQTMDAFSEMGTNALPFLIKVFAHKPSLLAETADKARRTDPKVGKLLKIFGSAREENERRVMAGALIGNLRTDGVLAIPALMKVWNDPAETPDLKDAAQTALMAMHDLVAPYVSDFLRAAKSTNVSRRSIGVMFIGRCGPKARAAIPLLRDDLRQGDPVLSSAAAEALWKIDRETNVALQSFSEILTNTNLQGFAIQCLSEMGAAAKPAVSALLSIVEDTNSPQRLNAEQVIRAIDLAALTPFNAQVKSNSEADLTTLIGQLETAPPGRALSTIKMYGHDATPAVPALVKFVKNGRRVDFYLSLAADDLGEIGPAASPAVPALIALHPRSRDAVIAALGRIGPGAKDALPVLEKMLYAQAPAERWRAADAITKIAPQNASEVVPILQELEHVPPLPVRFADSDPNAAPAFFRPDPSSNYFRLAAQVTLWRIGLRTNPPIAAIISAMQNKDYPHISDWIQLLGDIGPPAKSGLPVLETLLDLFPDTDTALAIRKIDPKEYDRLNLPGLLAVPAR